MELQLEIGGNEHGRVSLKRSSNHQLVNQSQALCNRSRPAILWSKSLLGASHVEGPQTAAWGGENSEGNKTSRRRACGILDLLSREGDRPLSG